MELCLSAGLGCLLDAVGLDPTSSFRTPQSYCSSPPFCCFPDDLGDVNDNEDDGVVAFPLCIDNEENILGKDAAPPSEKHLRIADVAESLAW